MKKTDEYKRIAQMMYRRLEKLGAVGRDNAVNRKELLSYLIGLKDRDMRHAKEIGLLNDIMVFSNTKGYYIPDEYNEDDFYEFIKVENARAYSILQKVQAVNLHMQKRKVQKTLFD